MADQAELGLFLSNDVCRQQRGLLCPGTKFANVKLPWNCSKTYICPL